MQLEMSIEISNFVDIFFRPVIIKLRGDNVNRIRELRKQRKLTQKELAKHLQIADSTLSYWEMGRYEPDNKSLRKLADFFHVSIDHILCVNADDNNSVYSGIQNQRFSNTNLRVSEPNLDYKKNNSLFGRREFEELTNDEIDKLAEYALFLKTQRGKCDES